MDVFAAGQLAGLQNPRSIVAVIAEYIAEDTKPETPDVEITVAKNLLPDTYRGNPSLFANKVLSKLKSDQWQDCSGHQTPGKRSHVTIRLLRKPKPLHARRANIHPSIKQIVKDWLNLNLHKQRKLSVPIAAIPAFYMTHPEQLVYQIKRETNTPLKIKRLTNTWLIKRA